MKYNVNLTHSAEEDLFEIYRYGFTNDAKDKAEELYSRLYEKCIALREYPHHGYVPSELSSVGMDGFLESTCEPYRIIYQVIGKEVFIHCILDGRRDVEKLLYEKLIRE